jgi:exodeoxyribonuclease V gamma subunit
LRRDQQLTPALLRDLDKVWTQDRDAAYERFFGPGVTLTAMLAQPSRAAEERGDLGEPSRFGTLARRVFAPLLRCEELT